MKLDVAVALPSLAFLLSCLSTASGQQRVNCRWAAYGEWSECDGCTRTKVRTRHVEVYAQFGGAPCSGQATQTQPCVPQKGCPLQTGCGDRFRCTSGQCISQTLVCNGDQDCEDGLDERGCDQDNQYICDLDKTPPNSELTGQGYDVLTGKLRGSVINTRSFGGQCRKVFSGTNRVYYRLPQSALRYSFEVTVNNDDSDESYENSWSYMQHTQSDALFEHDRRTFHKQVTETKAHRLIILKNRVELAQFQNSAPRYLTLAEGFWKALSSLPLTYDYSAYRQLLEAYGTHYLSEGSLGGEYQALLEFDQKALDASEITDIEYKRCWRKVKRRFFFRKKVTITCEKLTQSISSRDGYDISKKPIKVNVIGGSGAFISALSVMDLENPEANAEAYESWASSVRDYPQVIDQKLHPLYELVKEVQCAGLKKLLLKRAIEEYLAEEHPCHCRPCQNNGQPLLTGSECRCVCRPGTSGQACEIGAVIGEQPGVIHGSWSCWSSWGACTVGQKKRTRSCNNPAPSRGGLSCIGPQEENSPCEEPEIQYLKTMEPQCFGLSVTPPQKCGPPPNLRNGYVEDPKDYYLVGNSAQYTCISGYYLSGSAIAQCTGNQRWTKETRVCRSAACGDPPLNRDVIATPTKATYQIGDRLSLSCPAHSVLDGEESEIMCNPSLVWSPSPESIHCKAAPTSPSPPSGTQCKLWEKLGKTGCVCKMPFECSTSLQLCARLRFPQPGLTSVCKLGALRCIGRSFTLVSDSDCNQPEETFTSCTACGPGTVCQESARKCICQNASECPTDSTPLCVRAADGSVATTMTECEVGARRCAGEQLNVISIEACPG